MKLTAIFYVAILLVVTIGRIATINRLKSEAKEAYRSGNYKVAIQKYTYLVDSLKVNEEEVILNLANACFQAKDTAHAKEYYSRVQRASIPGIRSRSNQQLGVLAGRESNFEKALTYFKQALKADPANEDARFNYELLMRKMRKKDQNKKDQNKQDKNKQDQNKQDQNKQDQNKQDQNKQDQNKQGQNKQDQNKQGQNKKDQNKQDQNKQDQNKQDQNKQGQNKQDQDKQGQNKQDQDKQDQNKQGKKDQELNGQQPPKQQGKKMSSSVANKLKELKLSEEKAKMILEAMKNSEIQYLQQKKRSATKPKDRSKPDW